MSDLDYVLARNVLAELERSKFRPMLGRNFINSPNWPTLVFVMLLVAHYLEKSSPGGFTVAKLLGRIPLPDGFEKLATEMSKDLIERAIAGNDVPLETCSKFWVTGSQRLNDEGYR